MAKRKLSSTQIYYRISLALLPIMLGLSLLYQAGIFIPTKIFPPCITHKWHKKETPLSFQKGMFSSSFFSFSRYAPKREYPLCTCMDFPRFWCTAVWL